MNFSTSNFATYVLKYSKQLFWGQCFRRLMVFIAYVLKYSKQLFWQYFRWLVVGWWYLVSQKNYPLPKIWFKSFKKIFDWCNCTLCTYPNTVPALKSQKKSSGRTSYGWGQVGGRLGVVGGFQLHPNFFGHNSSLVPKSKLPIQMYYKPYQLWT